MIPLPSDILPKDVNQWLGEGWFYVRNESGTYQICRYDHTMDDCEHSVVLPMDGKSFVAHHSAIYPHWPECGGVNLPDQKFAVFVTRLQKKQWKRTYNRYCVKLRVISDIAAHYATSTDHPSVVKGVFEPEYYNYSDIVNYRFKDGWKSCAISPTLVVMKSTEGPVLVFSAGEIIGTIDEANRFTCVNPGIKRRLLPHFDYMVE
jgi:hypothetical protein